MDIFTEYFFQQGVLGVIIGMLILVVIWQQKRIDKKDALIETLQEKRKTDTDAYTASYTTVAKEQIATQRDIVNAQNLTQRSLDSLVAAVSALQSLLNGKN